jgi:predicted AlkP superfamily pyrophosphatase or phosphodiesterase
MLAVVALIVAELFSPQAELPDRPRLVVVVSIDQFRADYLTRFADQYLPAQEGSTVGGFNFLASRGANYVDAHYSHVPTYTGPGHSVIMTGSVPAINGIVGNAWFDRAGGKEMYCVDDDGVETVGGTSNPMGPKNLRVTTVGDELKMATGGKSKVVGVAFKDRGSILLAGHAADTVVWFDGGTGNWLTSTHYAPEGKLDAWVEEVNALDVPQKTAGKSWTPLEGLDFSLARNAPFMGDAVRTPVFSHAVRNSDGFITSSFGQEYVFETVEKGTVAEGLGLDDVPDVLVINLATNDYVGHSFGPNSPEVLDISVRTDRLLSRLFNFLDRTVPGGLEATAIVVTADHGVVPIPDEAREKYRVGSAIRGSNTQVNAAVESALAAKYGAGKYVLANSNPNLYLDRALLQGKKADLAEAQRIAAEAVRGVAGVFDAFAGEDIAAGRLPQAKWVEVVANGFDRARCGDVVVLSSPGVLFSGGTGTSHGSIWPYDTHVPLLLFGPGVRPGTYAERVSVCDIAPTLSRMLRIEQPSGSIGRLLVRAVGD